MRATKPRRPRVRARSDRPIDEGWRESIAEEPDDFDLDEALPYYVWSPSPAEYLRYRLETTFERLLELGSIAHFLAPVSLPARRDAPSEPPTQQPVMLEAEWAIDRLYPLMYELDRTQGSSTLAVHLSPEEREIFRSCARTVIMQDNSELPVPPTGLFNGWRGEREDGILDAPGIRRARLALLAYLRPCWIRPITDWRATTDDVDESHRQLVNHLLRRYDVPPFLEGNWVWSSVTGLEWMVLLGQGISLRSAAARFGWRISHGLVRRLHTVPADCDLWACGLWLEVTRLGGGQREFNRLRRDPFFKDPTGTQQSRPKAYMHVPADTPEWLIKHGAALTDTEWEDILEWVGHERNEEDRRGRTFSWNGRSAASALESAQRYVASLTLDRPLLQWVSQGWNATLQCGKTSWSFTELISTRELAAEGRRMRHCVITYDEYYHSGESAIFSVTRDGVRALTLEIGIATLRIRQAHGARNRSIAGEECAAIQRWQEEIQRRRPH